MRLLTKLFRKDPPKCCPKCGKSDGWSILYDDPSSDIANDRRNDVQELLRPGGYKAIDYSGSMAQTRKQHALRYHCSHCGYDKVY